MQGTETAVAVPQLEMGQGITTLVAQIVADEAGADWRMVAVEAAPISPAYADPVLSARWAPLWMPAFASLGDADQAEQGAAGGSGRLQALCCAGRRLCRRPCRSPRRSGRHSASAGIRRKRIDT